MILKQRKILYVLFILRGKKFSNLEKNYFFHKFCTIIRISVHFEILKLLDIILTIANNLVSGSNNNKVYRRRTQYNVTIELGPPNTAGGKV